MLIHNHPDPSDHETAPHLRKVFQEWVNDSEAVALINGGHAVGKANGKGCNDTPSSYVCTSGIETQWTTCPFEWIMNILHHYYVVVHINGKFKQMDI